MVLIHRNVDGKRQTLHDQNKRVMVFHTVYEAKGFLIMAGYTDQKIKDEGITFDTSGIFSDEEMAGLLGETMEQYETAGKL